MVWKVQIDALGQKGLATAQGEAGEIKSQADVL